MAQAEFRTQTGRYALCGEGLCVGYDGGDAVTSSYPSGFPFTAGQVVKVVYDLAGDAYEDIEQRFAAKLARD